MTELLASYRQGGELHTIELVRTMAGALVLDRTDQGPPVVVAELDRDEGRAEAMAVLHRGGYLRRARDGEKGLGRLLEEPIDVALRRLPRAA
jgi:hypothetical protein